jgi:hypothetical protein
MTLRQRIGHEWQAFRTAARGLDPMALTVLLGSIVLVFVHVEIGSKRTFRELIVPHLDVAELGADVVGLMSWAWWFGWQGLLGFAVPIAILMLVFKQSPRQIGLGLGDWKLAGLLGGLYLPVVAIGTWVLSDTDAFLYKYPHFDPAAERWDFFLIYHALFLFYWMGWEYLWRGFVLFGSARALGLYAIVAQTVPFALLHIDKPLAEAFLSILGGVALGALVWRCRSFWIAVPLHSAQMLLLDLWCSLRQRTGARGVGLEALIEALRGF